jgi:competence ComEA-like helix-hairpin-helix protein
MRRRLFFLIDRLEIQRSERIAVSVLMVVLVAMAGYYTTLKPQANYDPDYYAELEQVFAERSRTMNLDREQILARYEPGGSTESITEAEAEIPVSDTALPDTTQKVQVAEPERINVNEADSEELQELPGIGPAFAERILEWREENGEFTSKEQLLEIRGIGERRLEVIKPLITL